MHECIRTYLNVMHNGLNKLEFLFSSRRILMSHSKPISDLTIHFPGYGPPVLKNIKERPAIIEYSRMNHTDTDPNCLIQFVYTINTIQIEQIELHIFHDVFHHLKS